jgi:hypothetical protein
VVVDNLHGAGIARGPLEEHTPLIVNPNRMKSFPPAPQCLEAVAGRRSKIAELGGVVQVQELATCRPPQIRWKTSDGS